MRSFSLIKDPFVLVVMARDTHLYGLSGDNKEMKKLRIRQEHDKFNGLSANLQSSFNRNEVI
jgi:hypothetical protein